MCPSEGIKVIDAKIQALEYQLSVLKQAKQLIAADFQFPERDVNHTPPTSLVEAIAFPQFGSDLPIPVIPNEYNGMQAWVAIKGYLKKRGATPGLESEATIPELTTAMQVGRPKMKGQRFRQTVLNAAQARDDQFELRNNTVRLRPEVDEKKTV